MSKELNLAAKQKWAGKQPARGFKPREVATSGRLPPGQQLTAGFSVPELGGPACTFIPKRCA